MYPIKCAAISLSLTLVFCCSSAQALDYDFRQTRWGNSKEVVLASENINPYFKDETTIGYKTTVDGRPCLLIYAFDLNVRTKQIVLVKAVYRFEWTPSSPEELQNQFFKDKTILSEKYGAPLFDSCELVGDSGVSVREQDAAGYVYSGKAFFSTHAHSKPHNILTAIA